MAFSYDSNNYSLPVKNIYRIGDFVIGTFRMDSTNGQFNVKNAQIASIGAAPKTHCIGCAAETTTGLALDFQIDTVGNIYLNTFAERTEFTGARVLVLSFAYRCR